MPSWYRLAVSEHDAQTVADWLQTRARCPFTPVSSDDRVTRRATAAA
jgi:hypothetical protein